MGALKGLLDISQLEKPKSLDRWRAVVEELTGEGRWKIVKQCVVSGLRYLWRLGMPAIHQKTYVGCGGVKMGKAYQVRTSQCGQKERPSRRLTTRRFFFGIYEVYELYTNFKKTRKSLRGAGYSLMIRKFRRGSMWGEVSG